MKIQPQSTTAFQVLRTAIVILPANSTESFARVEGNVLDADGNILRQISYTMTVAEYNDWGSDDTYPTTLLLTNNGLTPV